MSVHGHGQTTFVRPDDVSRRERNREVAIPRPVKACLSMADVLAETEKGALMVAEARARAEAERMETERMAVLKEEAAAQRRAKVEAAINDLMQLAADVFAVQLNLNREFDRACAMHRFTALANGSMVDTILRTWRNATYDPKAYLMGYEYLTGHAPMWVHPQVYRNEREVQRNSR